MTQDTSSAAGRPPHAGGQPERAPGRHRMLGHRRPGLQPRLADGLVHRRRRRGAARPGDRLPARREPVRHRRRVRARPLRDGCWATWSAGRAGQPRAVLQGRLLRGHRRSPLPAVSDAPPTGNDAGKPPNRPSGHLLPAQFRVRRQRPVPGRGFRADARLPGPGSDQGGRNARPAPFRHRPARRSPGSSEKTSTPGSAACSTTSAPTTWPSGSTRSPRRRRAGRHLHLRRRPRRKRPDQQAARPGPAHRQVRPGQPPALRARRPPAPQGMVHPAGPAHHPRRPAAPPRPVRPGPAHWHPSCSPTAWPSRPNAAVLAGFTTPGRSPRTSPRPPGRSPTRTSPSSAPPPGPSSSASTPPARSSSTRQAATA